VGEAALFTLVVSGCTSEPVAPGDTGNACQFGREQQGFTPKCLTQSLDPVTDPASPDFGRVNCSLIELGSAGTDFCDCSLPGYAPATGIEIQNAFATLEANGECQNACCEEVCFCELLQLSGDDLAACQGGDATLVTVQRHGWCYVEPDLGVGDPSSVEDCPLDERRQLLFTPVRSSHLDIISCETAPG